MLVLLRAARPRGCSLGGRGVSHRSISGMGARLHEVIWRDGIVTALGGHLGWVDAGKEIVTNRDTSNEWADAVRFGALISLRRRRRATTQNLMGKHQPESPDTLLAQASPEQSPSQCSPGGPCVRPRHARRESPSLPPSPPSLPPFLPRSLSINPSPPVPPHPLP